MLLAWFDTAEVDRFAALLVREVTRRLPPSQVDSSSKKAVERLSRMTDVLSDQLRAFAQSQRLNVYKRARLGNRVKWQLKDAGYPEPFVDAFTTEVVTLLAVTRRARG
jgi:hypothetical protein